MEDITFLVRQAQRGNDEAFIQLISGYEKVLYVTAQKFLRNNQDVADVMQDTILICYRDIGKLKNPKYFNTWMYKILVNNCKKYFHETSNVPIAEFDQAIDSSSQRLEMTEMIDQISDTYKIPLILFYYNDLSMEDISQVLDIPVGTVKSRLSRGRSFLEEIYRK